jgi:hypothetical protein
MPIKLSFMGTYGTTKNMNLIVLVIKTQIGPLKSILFIYFNRKV